MFVWLNQMGVTLNSILLLIMVFGIQRWLSLNLKRIFSSCKLCISKDDRISLFRQNKQRTHPIELIKSMLAFRWHLNDMPYANKHIWCLIGPSLLLSIQLNI